MSLSQKAQNPADSQGNKSQEQENQFKTIQSFTCLDEIMPEFVKKPLPSVMKEVANYMTKEKILAASITCSGATTSSKRYFVNIEMLNRELSKKDIPKITSMHPLIHFQMDETPEIVVIKCSALNRSGELN